MAVENNLVINTISTKNPLTNSSPTIGTTYNVEIRFREVIDGPNQYLQVRVQTSANGVSIIGLDFTFTYSIAFTYKGQEFTSNLSASGYLNSAFALVSTDKFKIDVTDSSRGSREEINLTKYDITVYHAATGGIFGSSEHKGSYSMSSPTTVSGTSSLTTYIAYKDDNDKELYRVENLVPTKLYTVDKEYIDTEYYRYSDWHGEVEGVDQDYPYLSPVYAATILEPNSRIVINFVVRVQYTNNSTSSGTIYSTDIGPFSSSVSSIRLPTLDELISNKDLEINTETYDYLGYSNFSQTETAYYRGRLKYYLGSNAKPTISDTDDYLYYIGLLNSTKTTYNITKELTDSQQEYYNSQNPNSPPSSSYKPFSYASGAPISVGYGNAIDKIYPVIVDSSYEAIEPYKFIIDPRLTLYNTTSTSTSDKNATLSSSQTLICALGKSNANINSFWTPARYNTNDPYETIVATGRFDTNNRYFAVIISESQSNCNIYNGDNIVNSSNRTGSVVYEDVTYYYVTSTTYESQKDNTLTGDRSAYKRYCINDVLNISITSDTMFKNSIPLFLDWIFKEGNTIKAGDIFYGRKAATIAPSELKFKGKYYIKSSGKWVKGLLYKKIDGKWRRITAVGNKTTGNLRNKIFKEDYGQKFVAEISSGAIPSRLISPTDKYFLHYACVPNAESYDAKAYRYKSSGTISGALKSMSANCYVYSNRISYTITKTASTTGLTIKYNSYSTSYSREIFNIEGSYSTLSSSVENSLKTEILARSFCAINQPWYETPSRTLYRYCYYKGLVYDPQDPRIDFNTYGEDWVRSKIGDFTTMPADLHLNIIKDNSDNENVLVFTLIIKASDFDFDANATTVIYFSTWHNMKDTKFFVSYIPTGERYISATETHINQIEPPIRYVSVGGKNFAAVDIKAANAIHVKASPYPYNSISRYNTYANNDNGFIAITVMYKEIQD